MIILQLPYHNLAVRKIGNRCMFRLLAIGLFPIRAIHIMKSTHFTSSLIVNRHTASLVNGERSSHKLRPGHGLIRHNQSTPY